MNILQLAGRKNVQMILTEYSGHAKVLAKEILEDKDGKWPKIEEKDEKMVILTLGGDGTLHEFINGIYDVIKRIL